MPFDFADAIKSVGEAITSLFNYFSTAKENQSETEIIKDRRNLKEATNVAEEAFNLFDRYQIYLSKKDSKYYKDLKNRFNKRD